MINISKKNFIIGIIIILVLLVFVLLATRVSEPASIEKVPITEPKKVEEITQPPLPLASGKRTYELITDNPQNFQIIRVDIDPLDVKQGESQQVTVWVEDTEDKPITSENKVEGLIFTDNKEMPFSFVLREVSDSNGTTLTVWQGFWLFEDTYDKMYLISIKAKSAGRECSADLAFR